ncbi:hypothetical protein [Cribrihabitans pelagius]|uniref:hypothetical protein n=1 Tax=Cribrihabitans pelagius TaxID=1765746 RepID=UPI003B59BB4C
MVKRLAQLVTRIARRLLAKERLQLKADAEEFWQLVDYVDDIDIRTKLKEWESYYNCHRPHAALKGKAPFEVLRERLLSAPEKV